MLITDLWWISLIFIGGIHHYPVFNVADIAICIGAGLLALDAFKGDKKSGQKWQPISSVIYKAVMMNYSFY